MTVTETTKLAAPGGADRAGRALRRVARIAVMAVVLGFLVQGLILAILLLGRPWGTDLVVNVAGGVTWSLLVCTGVGIGTAIANGRPLLTGLIAMFFAPLALAVAKGGQRVMSGWLGAAQQEAILSLGTVSVLRALEYGLLGWLLGRLVLKDRATPWPYLGAGCAIGLGFGGPIAAFIWQASITNGAPLATTALVTTIVNEVVFPIGCSLVIYLGQDVGRNLKIAQSATPPAGPPPAGA